MASSTLKDEELNPPVDDNQLTIRIPNPKVYMARQSLWIGHRGKPRCDHCRVNNLKVCLMSETHNFEFETAIQCDRVLPTCNHCSWAAGRECKYTPLPTPAHRGIPRCDRCRLKNLKVSNRLETNGSRCLRTATNSVSCLNSAIGISLFAIIAASKTRWIAIIHPRSEINSQWTIQ